MQKKRWSSPTEFAYICTHGNSQPSVFTVYKTMFIVSSLVREFWCLPAQSASIRGNVDTSVTKIRRDGNKFIDITCPTHYPKRVH